LPSDHPVTDLWRRPLRNLRLSVTDRCNLRCQYCMPGDEYVWLPREDLLSFEEMAQLTEIFTERGVEKVRLTGGEPLLRKGLPVLVGMLAALPRLRDLALTTNGILLAAEAQALRDAGLHRVTVSLDTLQPERFAALTKRVSHARVLEGLEATRRAGFANTKIDTVVMRGVNDDEMNDLLEYGMELGAEVRFIEYMDVGGATRWSMDQVVPRDEILARLGRRYGRIEPVGESTAAPAARFALPDGTVFGIIASTTAPFCGACDRSRLTADGVWYRCLYAPRGNDLRRLLRGGATREEILGTIVAEWERRADRGAEERLGMRARGVLVEPERLRKDPHLEMHTRGG
jgi:cyclic pyranopterin phosphate synthase